VTTTRPPVTLVESPHGGGVWLIVHDRLSPEHCRTLAAMLAEAAEAGVQDGSQASSRAF
jgi:hypothetical protein